jgi:hypothetical protein
MGRHHRRWALWGSGREVPAQQVRRPIAITDRLTRVEHSVTNESLTTVTHRHSGEYPALCGKRVLAASMTTPPGVPCEPCQIATAVAALAFQLLNAARLRQERGR